MITCLQSILNFFSKKDKDQEISNNQNEYSDFDYESLCELYFKNEWLKSNANSEGFESLWQEQNTKNNKKILFKLIDNFNYLKSEDASLILKRELNRCLIDWELKPDDTIFIGFKKHKYPDGSEIILNQIKPLLFQNNSQWKESNLFTYIYDGVARIKKVESKDLNLNLKNIVLVDDFIGTGGTAEQIFKIIKKAVEESKSDEYKIYVFCLAGMKIGVNKLVNLVDASLVCNIFDRATLLWPISKRKYIRKTILEMEEILHEGTDNEPLSKFSLGYGESETLYSYSKYNLPNNNFPIFWWNKYKDGNSRKPLFNRMQ